MTKKILLTKKQIEVLELRNNCFSLVEIAKKLGTTRQNISVIEKAAMRNIKKAEDTLKFLKLIKAPIWFTVDKDSNLNDVVGEVYRKADKSKIQIPYDGTTLTLKIRSVAGDKLKARRVLRKFDVGVTEDGEVIIM